MREAVEESGLEQISHLPYVDVLARVSNISTPLPFDLDIHEIPARKQESEHLHYDVRFLVTADPSIPLQSNEESNELRWVNRSEAESMTTEQSMLRQFAKVDALRSMLHP